MSLESSWILSTVVSERVLFRTIVIVIVFLIVVVESLRVVWVVVLSVGVVCRGSLLLVVKLIRTSPCTALSYPSSSPLALSICQGVVVFGVVLVELTGSCCCGVGWNVLISDRPVFAAVCDVEPKWPPSLRLPVCQSPSLRVVVGFSALC